MRLPHGHARRAVGNIAAGLLLAAALAANPARAWEYPLLPHVHGLAFFPETPSTEYHTSALLSAVYPNECWRLVDTVLVDSAHVRVTIAPAADCGDSVSTWTHSFDLGFLAAGMHTLNVHCTVLQDGQPPLEEEITVPFEVVQAPPPPPPPPQVLPLLEVIGGTRAIPGEPVTLTLYGFKPFECTVIRDERVVDQATVVATFDWAESCPDTSRRWQRSFAMGSYPAGDYRVNIYLSVNAQDSSYVQEHAALIRVRDPNTPPPVDTTVTLVNFIGVEPMGPTVDDHVTVRVRGRYPFACGRIQDALMSGDQLWLTLYREPGCSDSSRTWEQAFELGPLSGGDHVYNLDVRVRSEGITTSHYYPVAFHVTDPNAPPPPPPPPPPPDDSLTAGLSPSRPNPFRDETSFSVSLDEAQPAEVSVFDLGGRRVTTIHRGLLPTGTSTLAWNGRRADGSRAPGGIYFYRLTLEHRVVNRRVVLLGAP